MGSVRHGLGRGLPLVFLFAIVGALAAGAAPLAAHASLLYPSYSVVTAAPQDGGGEPSIINAPDGRLYVSYPGGGGMDFYRSTDLGAHWMKGAYASDASGDTCLGVDQSSAVYQCNLAGSGETAPLQSSNFKSIDHGDHWTKGTAALAAESSTCGTSCNIFGTDRQWTDAAILPPATDTAHAEVVLMYHDFYGPSQIWVNISTDGGATYGPSKDVLASPSATPSGVISGGQAQLYSMCNTIPAGVSIAKGGPHKGRIFVGWLAADVAANATGCNLSQAEAFHSLWVAWSDDGGNTWTPQLAFDGGVTHDTSGPFAGFTLDNQGNPYFAFMDNLGFSPSCAYPQAPTTACEYDMYVVSSPDGGSTWTGNQSTPLLGGGQPFKVNSDSGTHFFPGIAVSDPGHVVVSYLYTESIIPMDATGKTHPGGVPTATWVVYAAQTDNLNAANAADVRWARTKVTQLPMHLGDICNLGIACVPRVSNRNLLDFIQVAIDNNGCSHIAFTNDFHVALIQVANQTAGCFTPASQVVAAPATPPVILAPLPNTGTPGGRGPLTALAFLLLLAGLATAAVAYRIARSTG